MRKRFQVDGLTAVGDMDGGRVDEAVKLHIRRAIEDCEDRPGEDKVRKVTLEVAIKPVSRQDGATCDIELEAKVKSAIPNHVSAPTTARVLHGGDAWFNDMSEDAPDQRTIDDVATA